jgi:hypothetical protein
MPSRFPPPPGKSQESNISPAVICYISMQTLRHQSSATTLSRVNDDHRQLRVPNRNRGVEAVIPVHYAIYGRR